MKAWFNKLLKIATSKYCKFLAIFLLVLLALFGVFCAFSNDIDNRQYIFGVFIVIFFTVSIIVGLGMIFFAYRGKSKQSIKPRKIKPQNLKSELKLIFKNLKDKKRNFRNIPWILTVGPTAAGKSKLFADANFNLLKLNEHDMGVNIWYSPKFLVFDVSSELFDPTSVAKLSSEFKYLLGFLKRKRISTPISSLILTLPIDSLIQTATEELKDYATNIAKNFERLQSKLKIKFPVYLIVTKTDLAYGFHKYVGDSNKEDLKQIFGWSSNLKTNETLEESEINKYFEEFTNNLNNQIYREQISATDNTDSAFFSFYRTIKNLVPSLKTIIEKCFTSAAWHLSPLHLRGVYFSAIKSDTQYSYLSFICDGELKYSKVPHPVIDKQSKFLQENNSMFFLEDLFYNKILKESSLVTHTGSYSIINHFLKWLFILGGMTALTLFQIFTFLDLNDLKEEVSAVISKSWDFCSSSSYWENDNFCPLLIKQTAANGEEQFSINNTKINGMDNLAFVLNFYTENDARINIPLVYSPSDLFIDINKEKDRAKNTILYTSLIRPLIDGLLCKYSKTCDNFDKPAAENFANLLIFSKLLYDYDANARKLFPYPLSTQTPAGLSFDLLPLYQSFFKNSAMTEKFKPLAEVSINLENLLNSNNVPYGIEESLSILKKSDLMTNSEIYNNNVSNLIDYCLNDYFAGSESMKSQNDTKNSLIKEFLEDAKMYKKDESSYFKNISPADITEKENHLKQLLEATSKTNLQEQINGDFTKVTNRLVAKTRIPNVNPLGNFTSTASRLKTKTNGTNIDPVATFNDSLNKIYFKVCEENFKNQLFYELGLKKSLIHAWFLRPRLTEKQYYLFYNFKKVFKEKTNDFSSRYEDKIESLKMNLSYSFALKYLAGFLHNDDKNSAKEFSDNIFSLLGNKNIHHNADVDLVIRYLVTIKIVSEYANVISNLSFPFTWKEFPSNKNLLAEINSVNKALDQLALQIDNNEQTDTNKSDDASSQSVLIQNILNVKIKLPENTKDWLAGAKKITAFINENKDFVSNVYLMGTQYSKDLVQTQASDIWSVAEFVQANSIYKSAPMLTRTSANVSLGKVALIDTNPAELVLYKTLDAASKKRPKNALNLGTFPLFKFMFNNITKRPENSKSKYWITWDAAKFDKELGLWITTIHFYDPKNNPFNFYIGFTMPENASCITLCLNKGK